MKTPARVLALALCAIAAATLALMSMQIAYSAMVCLAAIVASTDRYKIGISERMESRLAMGVAILFALRWMLLPSPDFGSTRMRYVAIGLLDYAQAYPIAQALLLWMVLLLFLRRGSALPFTLPLYPALVVILAGTMPPRALASWSGTAYQGAALALAMVSGAYFVIHTPAIRDTQGTVSHARRNAYVLMFPVVLLLGWGLGLLLYRHGQDLDMVLADLVRDRGVPMSPGFSGEGRLDRVSQFKSTNGDTIALHVTSAEMPGYLRGRAFDTFDGRRWSSTAASKTVKPISATDGIADEKNWFPLATGDADLGSGDLFVEPVSSLRGAVFTQLESARVSVDRIDLSVDAHRIVEAGQIEPGVSYRVAGICATDPPPNSEERKNLAAIPESIDPRIHALANEISRGRATDEARVHAVVSYLNATCEYSLDPPKVVAADPVTGFLFESHAGHCEFFATSAALLLRCAGVPCRYVTGFVAGEQNAYGGYWVARNKDAHAWVEAYIDGEGWITVEATPASGVPTADQSKMAQLWDYATHRAKGIVASIRNMNAKELLARARMYWPHMTAVVCSIVVGVFAKRYFARFRKGRAAAVTDPLVVSMHRKLRAKDREAAKLGFVRATHETINRFADRVEKGPRADIAAWYRAYARARYACNAEDVATITGGIVNSMAKSGP